MRGKAPFRTNLAHPLWHSSKISIINKDFNGPGQIFAQALKDAVMNMPSQCPPTPQPPVLDYQVHNKPQTEFEYRRATIRICICSRRHCSCLDKDRRTSDCHLMLLGDENINLFDHLTAEDWSDFFKNYKRYALAVPPKSVPDQVFDELVLVALDRYLDKKSTVALNGPSTGSNQIGPKDGDGDEGVAL